MEKVELLIPNTLHEITLEQYQRFIEAKVNNVDEEVLKIKAISIFCNVPEAFVYMMKQTDVVDISKRLYDLFESQKTFFNQFELNNVKFGFIPNLEEITHGEYIDLDTNIVDWTTYHKAMAVMFRPITEQKKDNYLIEKYEGTANYSDVMKYAPMSVVFGAMLFFYHLGNELLMSSVNYLEKELKKMSKEKLNTMRSNSLINDGDGINIYINSLKEMLQSLMILQCNPLERI